MSLGLHHCFDSAPDYSKENKRDFAIAGVVVFSVFTAIAGAQSAYDSWHYNSDVCTDFRASAEAEALRDVNQSLEQQGFTTEPIIYVSPEGWRCGL